MCGPGREFIFATDSCVTRLRDSEILPPMHAVDSVIQVPFRETGCVLTPCLTFNTFQPCFKLAVYCSGSRKYIMTRCGLIDVTGLHDDIIHADDSVRITPAMLLDCGRKVYAGYAVRGEVRYIEQEEVVGLW